MRISDRMIYERATLSTRRTVSEMDDAARQAATGVRITHPSDDSVAAGGILVGRAHAERFASIARSAERAFDELVQADVALGSLGAILVRAQQLAIQAANETHSEAGRDASALEVEAMIRGAAVALNAKVGNRFIFGGNQDASPPFDETGAYLGDIGVRSIEVAPGILLDTSLRADQIANGVGGGVDLFATLRELADALAANDVAGIQGTLDALTQGVSQVAAARADVGGMMKVLTSSVDAARAGENAAVIEVSRLADADPIEAASRLALATHALDAALTVAARSFRLTLLDKLR